MVHLKVYLYIKSYFKEVPVINTIHFDPFSPSPNSKTVNNKSEYFSTDLNLFTNNKKICPGCHGSVDSVDCEAKGHRFDSQSGHMPGL